MDFEIPEDIKQYLAVLDKFIDDEITPLQMEDDNNRFFDHRREHARTDWDNNGLPRPNGKNCCAKCAAAPIRPGICVSACRKNLVGLMAQ